MWPKDEDEGTNVSNENNFSAYSGLRMLEFVLANNTDGADAVLTKAKQDVDKLIEGLEKWFNADGLFSEARLVRPTGRKSVGKHKQAWRDKEMPKSRLRMTAPRLQ